MENLRIIGSHDEEDVLVIGQSSGPIQAINIEDITLSDANNILHTSEVQEELVRLGSGSNQIFLGGSKSLVEGAEGSDFIMAASDAAELTVDYRYLSEGFAVELGEIVSVTGISSEWTDQIDGLDLLIGSDFDDTFTVTGEFLANGLSVLASGGDDIYAAEGSGLTVDYSVSNVGLNIDLESGMVRVVDQRSEIGPEDGEGDIASNEGEGAALGAAAAESRLGSDTLFGLRNVVGTYYQDRIIGSVGDDFIDGGAGADVLIGGAGSDTLIGGEGNDTALYEGSQSDYRFGVAQGLLTVTHIATGAMDTLDGIETLEFADGPIGVSLDVNGGFILSGSSIQDTITVTSDAGFTLEGGAGADVLEGGPAPTPLSAAKVTTLPLRGHPV